MTKTQAHDIALRLAADYRTAREYGETAKAVQIQDDLYRLVGVRRNGKLCLPRDIVAICKGKAQS